MIDLSIISLFPELYEPFLKTSLVNRAQEKGAAKITLHNLFTYAAPKERIDGHTYGPGAGMVIKPEIIERALNALPQSPQAYKIFFSPHGKKIDQPLLRQLASIAQERPLMLLPARYEGMDARIEEEYADMVVSLGDFVLMGGDLPAMVLVEGLLRLVPGIVGKEESVEKDSFSAAFVDYPEYTEPVLWKNHEVPAILRSGNHEKIRQWREEQAAQRTVMHHFDWLRSHISSPNEKAIAQKYIPPHYVVLMHSQIRLPNAAEGTSSVTSLDIHDIARSARTYGLKKYFIVTPLKDQQKIVERLLSFWKEDIGISYNPHRHEALSFVELHDNLQQVIEEIERIEGTKPVLIATAARSQTHKGMLHYTEQEKIWTLGRPVLFLLGTARGLSDSLINQCDFVLVPLEGFSAFNHLSVRSAAAIIFDRWLGIIS